MSLALNRSASTAAALETNLNHPDSRTSRLRNILSILAQKKAKKSRMKGLFGGAPLISKPISDACAANVNSYDVATAAVLPTNLWRKA